MTRTRHRTMQDTGCLQSSETGRNLQNHTPECQENRRQTLQAMLPAGASALSASCVYCTCLRNDNSLVEGGRPTLTFCEVQILFCRHGCHLLKYNCNHQQETSDLGTLGYMFPLSAYPGAQGQKPSVAYSLPLLSSFLSLRRFQDTSDE